MFKLPDCSDGSVYIYDVDENGEIWDLCGDELPVLRTSARTAIIDSRSEAFRAEISRYESRFISYLANQMFYPLLTVTCCNSVEVTSDETIAGGHNDYLLGIGEI